MAVDVVPAKGGEGLVIHHDHVRRSPGLEDAQGVGEVFGADLPVVLKEHIRHLAPGHVGQAGVVPLDDQGHLQALQHVEGIGVGTHAHQDALLDHLKDRGAAHRIAHVGFRVVHHHGAGFLYNVHFRRVYVDAVAQ